MIQYIKPIRLKMAFFSALWFVACSGDDTVLSDNISKDDFFDEHESRQFKMGFTTWPYAPTEQAIKDTQTFLDTKGDIYSEHIDSEIPWNAWINGTELPDDFKMMVSSRRARRTSGQTMSLSLSLLNIERNDLISDFDGTTPDYVSMDDPKITDAYYNHVHYMVEQLNPDYLVISVEVDGLLRYAPEKWESYKSLMTHVKERIKNDFPLLPISESVMLHNFYRPDFGDVPSVITEISDYVNAMDFASVSFYPFLKNLKTTTEFQEALNFLHEQIAIPIAFAETGHLSEDLDIKGFNLFIAGNQQEQNDYLQTLLINAQRENYEYVIWWTHRDYDSLWETFPEEYKDLGQLWISTGIQNEDGEEKEALSSWEKAFSNRLTAD